MDNKVTYKKTIGVEVVIRRPNGEIEAVDVSSKYYRMTDAAFAKIKAATKAAGRGDALSYRNIQVDEVFEKTQGDMMDDSYTAQVKHMTMGE